MVLSFFGVLMVVRTRRWHSCGESGCGDGSERVEWGLRVVGGAGGDILTVEEALDRFSWKVER